jgi:hypothetical protein
MTGVILTPHNTQHDKKKKRAAKATTLEQQEKKESMEIKQEKSDDPNQTQIKLHKNCVQLCSLSIQ